MGEAVHLVPTVGQHLPAVALPGEVFRAVHHTAPSSRHPEGGGRLLVLLPSLREVEREQLHRARQTQGNMVSRSRRWMPCCA